jgi:hypothetical protein
MTPGERQEFMRIARRLIELGAYLKRDQKSFGLMVKRNKWTNAVMQCGDHFVEKFISEDLLQRDMSFQIQVGHFICEAKHPHMLF